VVAVYLLAALLLLLLNAFFVLAEFAAVKMRPTRVQELAERGDARARIVGTIQANLDEFLSVCQVGITFASIGLGFVGEPAVARLIRPGLEAIGVANPAAAHGLAIAIAYLAVSFLHIVIGEQVPKSFAIRAAERAALATARPLSLFRILFWPANRLLAGATRGVLALLRVPREARGEQPSEDELRIILGRSQEEGLMPFRRLLFIENVFDLGALKVRDVMRPRATVKTLRTGAPWEESWKTIRESRFSRFPLVQDDKPERPLGVVHVKDLVIHGRPEVLDLGRVARPFLTTTEDTPVEALLSDLQRKRGHMTIVLDRKDGRWTGAITMEDIIEEIIGTVEDEFEVEPQIFLGDALSLGRIFLDLEAPSIEEAVRSTIARVPAGELPAPADRVTRAILERERALLTYFGRGVSIPHGRIEGIERPFLVFARSKEGIPIRNVTERARLVFILLTPAGAPHHQVRLLARIGGILESEFVDERLRAAETPQEILEAIKAGETASLG
jgi:CBS domain containing-hemolysin-like protein/mannitol/fructose-specific phosphotransferase system IIA component (Ntr-type)